MSIAKNTDKTLTTIHYSKILDWLYFTIFSGSQYSKV